jgi:hypothetical protein
MIDSRGGANTAVDPKKTKIVNVNMTDIDEVEHGTIDDLSQKTVVKSIVNELEPATSKE